MDWKQILAFGVSIALFLLAMGVGVYLEDISRPCVAHEQSL